MKPRTFRWTSAIAALVGVLLFAWSWLFRFNDPEGRFSGLVDDHFFYLVRGWQMLFGDLPDRDFVDPGAPLTFAIEAGLQWFNRGTWSEIAFCVTALSVGTLLTYIAARRASGSTLIGLAAGVFQAAMGARFYNYPKVLVYAVAIPALWNYVDRPTWAKRLGLAAITVAAFLLRHDHGIFVGLAVLATILLQILPWKDRLRHVVVYGLLAPALLTPYLVFLQVNGGVIRHFVTANAWSTRDRARAPFVVPTFDLSPKLAEDAEPGADWWNRGFMRRVTKNYEPITFWLIVALPILAMIALPWSRTATRPDWPHARRKLIVLIGLTTVLIVGFVRGNLEVRFGDVSVPVALLFAWLWHATWTVIRRRHHPALRVAAAAAFVLVIGYSLLALLPNFRERLDESGMTEKFSGPFQRYTLISSRLQTFPLEAWTTPDDSSLIKLSFYVRDCTKPTDRVFVGPYLPPLAALAERAYAGGHGDLRPDFFGTEADQRLTVSRLERQQVPIVFLQTGDDLFGFKRDFHIVAPYLFSRYRQVGEIELGGERPVTLLVSKSRQPTGTYRQTGWPCFR